MKTAKQQGRGFSLYEKVVMIALCLFFLGMLFMFFVVPRL
jgi:hypothetical protein